MQHEHNKKMTLIMLAVLLAVLVLAKLFGVDALVFLVFLCPVMMIAMMFGMNHGPKR